MLYSFLETVLEINIVRLLIQLALMEGEGRGWGSLSSYFGWMGICAGLYDCVYHWMHIKWMEIVYTLVHLVFQIVGDIHVEINTQQNFNKFSIAHLTHVYSYFQQPNIICLSLFTEPRCGPVTGAPISLPIPCDVDPQPLVDRRSSISLLKWGSCKRNDAPTPTAARQGLNDCKNNLFLMFFCLFFELFCLILFFGFYSAW